jgi:hypothetical protein
VYFATAYLAMECIGLLVSDSNRLALFYGIVVVIFLSLSYGFAGNKSRAYKIVPDWDLLMLIQYSFSCKTDFWYGEIIGILYGFFIINVLTG